MTAGTDGPGSGYAKFNYSDGFYEGNYVVKKHGMGRYVWSSTDDTDKFTKEYYGEWKDNKIHGLGAYTWPDGRQYHGEWRNNLMHGVGLYTWADGKLFVGEYKGNKKDGYGIYKFKSG